MPDLNLEPGFTLHYLDMNRKGTQGILLLHGLGATSESWGFQVPALTQAGYRVIAADLRGFGRSRYSGKFSPALHAKDAAALIKHLGFQKVDVAGISMGGTVALQFAVDYPDCVDRLVLINTFARLRPPKKRQWLYYAYRMFLVTVFGMKAQAAAVARRIFPKDEQAELRRITMEQVMQANARSYRAAMIALSRLNLLNRLNEIRAKTLVITGSQDTTVPVDVQKELLMIPGSRQAVIQGSGHAVTADAPDTFNQVLLDFLEET